MTSEQEELVKVLKNQVHLIMEKHRALKKKYGQLILENDNLTNQIEEQNVKIEALQEQYSSARLASGVLVSEGDKEMARTEINRIVREIDSCIALLNR